VTKGRGEQRHEVIALKGRFKVYGFEIPVELTAEEAIRKLERGEDSYFVREPGSTKRVTDLTTYKKSGKKYLKTKNSDALITLPPCQ
jgi:hypothetical protein